MNQQNSMNRVKSEHRGFREAFESLPSNKIMEVREHLMNRLGWSLSIFYYKKRGDTPIWEHEEPVIEEVFSPFNLHPWIDSQINEEIYGQV